MPDHLSPRPTISLLVDARERPPGALPPLSGVEVVVAGPGQAVDASSDTPEAELFHALVAASSGALCIWHRAGDIPTPDRISVLLHALTTLQVPVVAHRLSTMGGRASGRTVRLPGPVVVRGATVHPDTIAFRRELAAFAPTAELHLHGTRRALLAWAAVRDAVGFVDRVLLQRPPRPPPSTEDRLRRDRRSTQASHAVLATLQRLAAPQALVSPAIDRLLEQSQAWTWSRWDLLLDHRRPHWSPPPEPEP